jgi:outer membrane protein assembly factor BamB
VRWARNLNAYASDRDQKRGIVWSGPVLAGDRLIVAGSHGEALSLSPYTGEPRGRLTLNEGVLIAPVVAEGTLYFLDEGGRLVAMR